MKKINQENVKEAIRLASGVTGLSVDADKIAHSFRRGSHGRRRAGQGEAFWQFRPYAAGDASRAVDWRQTAKRGDVFVREKEWAAAQAIWLYRDASRSMRFSSARKYLEKTDYAERLLLALALVFLEGGERVGVLGSPRALQSGHDGVFQLAEALSDQRLLEEGGRPVAAHSSIFLISDFYFPVEELSSFCENLSARQVTGTLVQVYDPSEKALPYEGRIRFEDVEGSGTREIGEVSSVRDLYQQKFEAHREKIKSLSDGIGWRFWSVGTDTPLEDILARIYAEMEER